MGSIFDGIFDAIFGLLRGIWDFIVGIATFNPIGQLDTMDLGAVYAPVHFIAGFVPISTFGGVVVSVIPVLIMSIIIMLIWRWFNATNSGGD